MDKTYILLFNQDRLNNVKRYTNDTEWDIPKHNT